MPKKLVALMNPEANNKSGQQISAYRVLELAALVVSLITGLMTASLVVFKGGALVNTVQSHETRLSKIELTGSPPISEHIKLDDAREDRTREAIKDVKEALAKITPLVGKVDVLDAKLDSLKEQIAKKP